METRLAIFLLYWNLLSFFHVPFSLSLHSIYSGNVTRMSRTNQEHSFTDQRKHFSTHVSIGFPSLTFCWTLNSNKLYALSSLHVLYKICFWQSRVFFISIHLKFILCCLLQCQIFIINVVSLISSAAVLGSLKCRHLWCRFYFTVIL